MRGSGLTVLAFLLGACAGIVEPPVADWPTAAAGNPEVVACREAFRAIDKAVAAAGVRDAEAARIDGFPYLRSNRFLASFRNESLNDPALEAWVDRLAALDRQARLVESANLPPDAAARLEGRLGGSIGDVGRECRELLRRHDLRQPEGLALLRRNAHVPDVYSTWLRLAGLYPLTSIGVAAGFGLWKASTRESFERFEGAGTKGAWVLYRPAVASERARSTSGTEIAAIIADSRDNPLGIPEPRGAALSTLVERFAPIWRIERAGPADDIGLPGWRADGDRPRPAVDTSAAVGFARLSHTRFGGEILPQISYTVWFPERPKTSALDILGGPLDAVIWRVTVGWDGRPLVYDTVHACGCYHLFFPVPPAKRKETPEDLDLREEAFVPAPGRAPGPGERVVVSLLAGSHYVTDASLSPPGLEDRAARSYRLIPPGEVPDGELRSAALPEDLGGGRRSLFGADGIIAGTERLERFLLWPMGIANPGAMRQWGNHATAFVGHRHFDDPELLERAFER